MGVLRFLWQPSEVMDSICQRGVVLPAPTHWGDHYWFLSGWNRILGNILSFIPAPHAHTPNLNTDDVTDHHHSSWYTGSRPESFCPQWRLPTQSTGFSFRPASPIHPRALQSLLVYHWHCMSGIFNQGQFWLPGNIWQCLGTSLVVTAQAFDAWKPRAAKHPPALQSFADPLPPSFPSQLQGHLLPGLCSLALAITLPHFISSREIFQTLIIFSDPMHFLPQG